MTAELQEMEWARRLVSPRKGGTGTVHSSDSTSSAGGGRGGGFLERELLTLAELGLSDDQPLCLLADSLFARFHDLAEAGGKNVSLDAFMKDCISRGLPAPWADAAFRSFESPPGFLSKFSYCLALVSLLISETELIKRPAWIKLRRRVVFFYYDTFGQEILDLKAFENCLEDISTTDYSLKSFGISISPEALSDRESNQFSPGATNSIELMGQQLAMSKLQLAERTAELQELQFAYLQMEKKLCQLKLDLAEERAKKDRDCV